MVLVTSVSRCCYWFRLFLCLVSVSVLVDGQRTIDLDSPALAQLAAHENLDQYWENRTVTLHEHVRHRFDTVLKHWHRSINRDQLRNKVDARCLDLVDYMLENPLKHEWIAKMFDAGLKIPVGLLSGTMTNLGDFDQCIGISVDNHEQQSFVGKYCLATVNLPRVDQFRHPIPLNRTDWFANYIQRWYENDNYHTVAAAICFPSVCSAADIRQMLLSYYRDFLEPVQFDVAYCQSNDEPVSHRTGLYLALAILATPWFLIVPATLIELCCGTQHQSTPFRILACFSIATNNRFLFQIKPRDREKTSVVTAVGAGPGSGLDGGNGRKPEFQFIHGIRALGALMIALSHAGGLCLVQMFSPVSVVAHHPTDMIDMSKRFYTQPFFNGSAIVWTFFMISGFLLTYLNAQAQRPVKTGIVPYILLRYLRFTPPLLAMMCMTIALELFGYGPLFHPDILWPTLRPCYQNWWTHLTYINNLFDYSEMCNIQTWYLSADMQLHIIAYLILVLYSRNRRYAYMACAGLVAFGAMAIVAPVAAGWVKIVTTHRIFYTRQPVEVGRMIYFSVSLALIPYFIGSALGLVVLENRVRFTRFQETLFWWLSILVLLALPFSTYATVDDPKTIDGDDTITTAILFALMVTLWSLANAWLLYQFANRSRTLTVGRFLSANFFKPLSRLSFSFYLTHLMTIWFSAHQTRTPIFMGTFSEVSKVLCTTVMYGMVLAYLLHISFEAPTIGLIILFFKNKRTKQGTAAVEPVVAHTNGDRNTKNKKNHNTNSKDINNNEIRSKN